MIMNVCYEDAGVNRELKIWVPLLNLKPAISPELSVLLVGDSWYKFCVLNGYRLQIHLASVVIRPIWGNILTINITLFVDQKIRVSSAPLISLSLKFLCCLDVRIKTLPKMLFFFFTVVIQGSGSNFSRSILPIITNLSSWLFLLL